MPRAYVPNDVREAIGVIQDYLSKCRENEAYNLKQKSDIKARFPYYYEDLAGDRARYYRQNANRVRELLSL